METISINALVTEKGNYFCKLEENTFAYFDKNGKILRFAQSSEWDWAKEKFQKEEVPENIIEKIWKTYQSKKDEIKKVNFLTNSFFNLIINYKGKAWWTRHEYSNGYAGKPKDITDMEIFEIYQRIKNKEPLIEFKISDIWWEKYGNCVGDELFPVECTMYILPDGRYFIQISGHGNHDDRRGEFVDEFIYTPR
jgi:hypothetical protein